MAWLRDLRLDHVRAQLRASADGEAGVGAAIKVADVAARYGFYHLGHFAAHYRRRFGELPSETVGGARPCDDMPTHTSHRLVTASPFCLSPSAA